MQLVIDALRLDDRLRILVANVEVSPAVLLNHRVCAVGDRRDTNSQAAD